MKDSGWFDACFTAKLATCQSDLRNGNPRITYTPDDRTIMEALEEIPTNLSIELDNGTVLTFKNMKSVSEFFYLQGVLSVHPLAPDDDCDCDCGCNCNPDYDD